MNVFGGMMSPTELFSCENQRVLVIGGATGMGEAAARLAANAGARVVVMDRVNVSEPGVQFISIDLSERDSIDTALELLNGPVDVVLSCAGVADGVPGIERINFIGHRYMIDRLLDRGWLPAGSAIGMISSAAGLGWQAELSDITEFLAIKNWDDAVKWVIDHNKANYLFIKRAMCAYVASESVALLRRGVRINALCPGPTDTPLARANAETWLGFGADFREDIGIEPSTPAEQAAVLLFLCSRSSVALTGQTVIADSGYLMAGLSGAYPSATPVAEFLFGKYG
jgi:NAD(P)-dependent dehydrogenase (short-subunit alcohol dehydrogenase family)